MCSDSLKVCMLVPFLHYTGGMERQAVQLARKLRERQVDLAIITGWYVEEYVQRRYPGLRWRDDVGNIPIYRVPVTRASWRLRLVLFGLWSMFLLTSRLQRFQIIHAHQLISTGVMAVFISSLLGRSVIVKLASGGEVGDLVSLRRAFFGHPPVGFLGRHIDRIVSLTSQIQSELLEVGFPPDKIVVIPNGVDTRQFRPASKGEKERIRENLALPKSPIVTFVGGLKPKKRVDFLLLAWTRIQERHPDAHLLLIGDGPLRPRLEALCRLLGLATSVTFIGAVENVHLYLRASDLFVLPSLGEGLANALLEAMATGLPVITTDTVGNRDVIVQGENGLLFPQDDEQALASLILRVLDGDAWSEQLGQAARETAQTCFSLDSVADQYLRLYAEIG